MVSFQYRRYCAKVKFTGIKKLFAMPEKRLIPIANRINKHRCFKIPKDNLAYYSDKLILGKYHCLTMQAKKEKSDRAILYIYGGGMVFGPGDEDVRLGADIARQTGADVWFPYYPLCTEHPATEATNMVFACYKELLKQYDAKNISFLGFSAGAGLSMGIVVHNNALGKPLPMPTKIIACSPGVLPLTEEELQKMWALNKKDIMLDAAFMTTLPPLMKRGKEVPDYMCSVLAGDFTDMPPLHFYYGENEILYAEAEYFEKKCKEYNIPYTMTVAPKMGHYYALQPQYPEGKKAYKEILEILKN